MKSLKTCTILILITLVSTASAKNAREYGIDLGIFEPGSYNAITDVKGVKVGHITLISGDNIRTGVTAVIPHSGNVFQDKVPAAIHVGNGFGKLAGYTQVKELGNLETPIILTNTLNVPVACNALISYTLDQKGNESVHSVNSLVGETNDGWLNDIRGRHVEEKHVLQAIKKAKSGRVRQGNVGAGTGTCCFGFKGGIGTSSRLLPQSLGGYTVGVLAQTNFGGVLQINGVPVGQEMDEFYYNDHVKGSVDGSCMMIVATDAPLCARNLERLAKRAMLGLARTGGIASNGSGDYVIAFSTASENFVSYSSKGRTYSSTVIRNDSMSSLFLAAIEATEEAIINSLFAAETMTGREGHTKKALPLDRVLELMGKYNKIK